MCDKCMQVVAKHLSSHASMKLGKDLMLEFMMYPYTVAESSLGFCAQLVDSEI